MSKIISIKRNKNYKILSIDQIKKFLNIISDKDNEFLEEIFFSVSEFAGNLLGICIGEAEIKIHYNKVFLYSSRIIINLKFGPVFYIKSINLINEKGEPFEIKDFIFLKDKQQIIVEKNFNQFVLTNENFFFEIVQDSKIDSDYKNFETICTKILNHINIVYKNRNSYIFEKSNMEREIMSLYQDLFKLLN
jgi:hypothetical protein